jgi:hypothetical protein
MLSTLSIANINAQTILVRTRLERRTLENTNIPKAFFTLHHVGRSCTNVIPVHCCSQVIPALMLYKVTVASLTILAMMCAQIIFAQKCLPTMTLYRIKYYLTIKQSTQQLFFT